MTDQMQGVRLGAYEVRELLGSGGMGTVYRGYDMALDREVAIKVLSADMLLPNAMARFKREARLAAALRHPNIVQVYHFGETDGRMYMVQELLPGQSLADKLRKLGKRRMSQANVKSTIAQLAAALDFAHGRGVIHRDVKPGNALYNAAGDLVLTDFGLARSADIRTTTTGPGVVMGTPGYIAPEQAVSSAGVTHACDIYSLGVVLFELLTGRLPFEADTPMGMVLKHLYDEPPPPSSLRPELPRAVDTLVLRALHKEPERRFVSAGALAEALYAAWPEVRSPKTSAKPAAKTTTTARSANGATARSTKTAATPAKKPTPKAKPTPKPAPPPPPAPAQRKHTPRMIVGLLTICIVSGLILFGMGVGVEDVTRGWRVLLEMVGG